MRFLTSGRRIVLIYFEEIKSEKKVKIKKQRSSIAFLAFFFLGGKGTIVPLESRLKVSWFADCCRTIARMNWFDGWSWREKEEEREEETLKKARTRSSFYRLTDRLKHFHQTLSFHLFQYTIAIRCHAEIVLIKIDRNFEMLSTRVAISFHICR